GARAHARAESAALSARARALRAPGGAAPLASDDGAAAAAAAARAGPWAPAGTVPSVWFAAIEAGVQGDSNPALDSVDLLAGEPGLRLQAATWGGWRPLRGRHGALETSAALFQSYYPAPRPALAPYDVTGGRVALAGALSAGPLALRAEGSARDLWTGLGRTHFATTFGLTLDGALSLASDRVRLRAVGAAAATDFVDVSPPDAAASPANRDAVHLLARAGVELALGRGFGAEAWGEFETDLAEGDDFDWRGGGGGLGLRKRAASRAWWRPAEGELLIDVSLRDYPHRTDDRRDVRIAVAGRAGWRAGPGSVTAEVTYFRSVSIAAYDYTRLAGGLGYRVDF
ncbi:MAG TPA: hypothetical protein VG389_13600, partial [Myxococcota bacterium]|nr:hypothetical protein [Myxococcota bacterium]